MNVSFSPRKNKSNNGPKVEAPNQSDSSLKVPTITKIKVVAAFLIVGFAVGVAYWVQQPLSDLKVDILNSTQSIDQGKTVEVSIIDFSFDQATLTIEKGTTVVWTNKDTTPHQVTGSTFSSGTLNPGQSFTYTFNQEGIYDYYCSFHPQMKGSITVTATQAGTTLNTPSEASQSIGSTTMQPEQSMVADTDLLPLPASLETTTESQMVMATDNTSNSDQELLPVEDTDTATDSTNIISATDTGAMHGAAMEQKDTGVQKVDEKAKSEKDDKGQLANSGPEDYLYLAIFGVILYFNRKKILKWRG